MIDECVSVYGHWDGLAEPLRLGKLYARHAGSREIVEFEFNKEVLLRSDLSNLTLDPRLSRYAGRQYPPQGHSTFGAFSDASPDRWGRLLMRRRLERQQRSGQKDPQLRLYELDYLLVQGPYRQGQSDHLSASTHRVAVANDCNLFGYFREGAVTNGVCLSSH